MSAYHTTPLQSDTEESVSNMQLRELTEDEQTILKLGIMSLHENRLISPIAASWLIQSLGLQDA